MTGDWDTHRRDIRRGWDYGRGRTNFNDYDDDMGTEGENAAATGGGALAGGVAVARQAGSSVGRSARLLVQPLVAPPARWRAMPPSRPRASVQRTRADDRRERIEDRPPPTLGSTLRSCHRLEAARAQRGRPRYTPSQVRPRA